MVHLSPVASPHVTSHLQFLSYANVSAEVLTVQFPPVLTLLVNLRS